MSVKKKMSIYQCQEKYKDVARDRTLITYSVIYPKGTCFTIGFLGELKVGGFKYAAEGPDRRFRVISTKPISKSEIANIEGQLKRRYCTRTIPLGGRSVLKETPSKQGYLCRHSRGIDGVFINEKLVCNEPLANGSLCPGNFLPDRQGNYVCTECGILHTYQDSCVEDEESEDEESYFEEEVSSYTERNLAPEEYSFKTHILLGGKRPDNYMAAVVLRLERNIAQWKKELETPPQDEVNAKNRAKNIHDRHLECRAINREVKTDKKRLIDRPADRQDVYLDKWNSLIRKSHLSKIHLLVRAGIVDTADLLPLIDCSSRTFYTYLSILETSGRLVSTKIGRRNTLTAIVKVPIRKVPKQNVFNGLNKIVVEPKKASQVNSKPNMFPALAIKRCSKCGNPFEITSIGEFKNVACSKCVKAIEDES